VKNQATEKEEEEKKKDKLNKVLEGIDNTAAKSSLMDKLKDADDSVLKRLREDQADQDAKLAARRELLKQRKRNKKNQEIEKMRLEEKMKQMDQ
jgi:hypothetical protein